MDLHSREVAEIIDKLTHPKNGLPEIETIRSATREGYSAVDVCWRLRMLGFKKGYAQIAIQRAIEAGHILQKPDWTLEPAE